MRVPKLCVHKASRRYYVRLNGEFHYLGPVGDDKDLAAAETARAALLEEWIAGGRTTSPRQPRDATLTVLTDRFLSHVDAAYSSGEARAFSDAFRPVLYLYPDLPVKDFGTAELDAVRDLMSRGGWLQGEALERALKRGQGKGWCRKTINQAVGRIKRAFRWGVREKLVPAETWSALDAAETLRRGQRTVPARETADVVPADEASVAAVLAGPFTPELLADMVRLQLLTGMRPGELVRLRWRDVDKDGRVVRRLAGKAIDLGGCWVYLPGLEEKGGRLTQKHKTAHHGHHRLIPLGPAARELLEKYAGHAPGSPIFSPAESKRQYDALRRAARKSEVQPSQQDRARLGARRPGPAWTVEAYNRAVHNALRRVNDARAAEDPPLPALPRFGVGQLRHNAATRLVETFGWDVARMVLGHSSVNMTRVYASDNLERVFGAMSNGG